ncbi:MAG TPA: thermonuclease family protein [Thermodesulfobacteriota bacterium]
MTRRPRLPSVLSLLFAALLVAGLAQWREGRAALVRKAVDGDTLLLATGEMVRLIGVDAPETDGPYTRAEPFGTRAAAFVREAAEGRRIRLEIGPERRDAYGRTLAYVHVDDLDLNAELIRRGLARAYRRFPHRRLDEFVRLEAEARAAGRGLWAADAAGAGAGRQPRPAR